MSDRDTDGDARKRARDRDFAFWGYALSVIILPLLTGMVFAGLFFIGYFAIKGEAPPPQPVAIAFAVVVVFYFLFQYLQGRPTLVSALLRGAGAALGSSVGISAGATVAFATDLAKLIAKTDRDLRELKREVEEKPANLSPGMQAELVAEIRKSVMSATATDLLSDIEARIQKRIDERQQENTANLQMAGMRDRLMAEVTALQLRGNLNLLFGAAVTFAALAVLWSTISITHNPNWTSDPWQMATVFGPRLALALFLQVFAYFFLKLYRTSLAEIKYFQNEITNIEAKHLALTTAIQSSNTEYLKEVIGGLLATERNHILSKDQTTVELEKARLDTDQRSAMFKMFTEFWQKKGG